MKTENQFFGPAAPKQTYLLVYESRRGKEIIAKITCASPEAFEEIRAKYFPDIPANRWTKKEN
jgi:hypothetical protein